MFFIQLIILRWFKESMLFFSTNGYLSLKFENFAVLCKNIHSYFDNKNDSIWKFIAIFCHTTSLIPSFSSNIFNYVHLKICIIPL
jgi:hypothetical protein